MVFTICLCVALHKLMYAKQWCNSRLLIHLFQASAQPWTDLAVRCVAGTGLHVSLRSHGMLKDASVCKSFRRLLRRPMTRRRRAAARSRGRRRTKMPPKTCAAAQHMHEGARCRIQLCIRPQQPASVLWCSTSGCCQYTCIDKRPSAYELHTHHRRRQLSCVFRRRGGQR